MASGLYDKAREKFLTGDIDWLNDTIMVTLVDGDDYTPDLANHEFFSSVPSAARLATETLVGKTATNGVADADDTTFTSVSGDQFELIIIWKDTGVESTSPLIAMIDTATGLPFTPTGSDILIAWDNGPDKIFKL